MPKVFISYRRADTGDLCDRLATRLRWALGDDAIFRDVNTILAGSSFPAVLRQGVETCPVMLALIGPSWLLPVGTPPRRRLDDPDDWVRAEIASALRLGHLVIPVLAEGAPALATAALPPDLAPLAQFAPLPLRPDPAFDQDVRALLAAIRPRVAWRPASWLTLAVGIYITLVYLIIVAAFAGPLGPVALPLAHSPVFDPVLAAFLEVIIGAFIGWRALTERKWGWLAVGALVAVSGATLFLPILATSSNLNLLYTLLAWPAAGFFTLLAGLIGPHPPHAPDTLHARWTGWHTALAILLGLAVGCYALTWITVFDVSSSAATLLIYGVALAELTLLMVAAGCVAAERAFAYGRVWWGAGAVIVTIVGLLGALLPVLPIFAHANDALSAALEYTNGVAPPIFVLFMLGWLTSYGARTPARKGKPTP